MMKLYNSSTRRVEPLTSPQDRFTIYTCGITPYDTTHLGHAFTYVVANERGNRPDDPNKRNPLDFVLWQARQPGEPAWPSPWGPGRPGWHIECSAMAVSHLGETIDIHAGGSDLVFPHHESEIAQVESLTGRPFVRFWLHTAMVEHEDEKMSKSLGNLVMVRDLLEQVSPDALRLYLAGYHYRRAWNYNSGDLHQAATEAGILRTAVTIQGGSQAALDPEPARSAFHQALANDLDTPSGVRVLLALAEAIITAANKGVHVQAAQSTLSELGGTLGLRLSQSQPNADVLAGWRNHARRFGLTKG